MESKKSGHYQPWKSWNLQKNIKKTVNFKPLQRCGGVQENKENSEPNAKVWNCEKNVRHQAQNSSCKDMQKQLITQFWSSGHFKWMKFDGV